jgi:hypothetical protein
VDHFLVPTHIAGPGWVCVAGSVADPDDFRPNPTFENARIRILTLINFWPSFFGKFFWCGICSKYCVHEPKSQATKLLHTHKKVDIESFMKAGIRIRIRISSTGRHQTIWVLVPQHELTKEMSTVGSLTPTFRGGWGLHLVRSLACCYKMALFDFMFDISWYRRVGGGGGCDKKHVVY